MAGALGRRALSALALRLAHQSNLPAAGQRCGHKLQICDAQEVLLEQHRNFHLILLHC